MYGTLIVKFKKDLSHFVIAHKNWDLLNLTINIDLYEHF